MKTKEITEEELIDFKQDLQNKYPGSVGKILGKGDAIFLQRAMDDDVIIYSSGTAIYSTSFTATTSPTKYANMKTAFDVAIARGYRPSNAFASGWFDKRKLLIKEARENFKEQTSVFAPVENKPMRELKAEYKEDIFVPQQNQQPTYERISQRPQLIQRQPNFFGNQNSNTVSQQILKDIGNVKPYPMRRQAAFNKDIRDFSAMMISVNTADKNAWGEFAKPRKERKNKKGAGRPKIYG